MIYQTIDAAGSPIWVDSSTGANWATPDAQAPAPTPLGFDASPFQSYLQYVANSGDVAGSITGGVDQGFAFANQDWLANPTGLFDLGYNQGNRRSLNPYYDPRVRDMMRGVAGKLGLSSADADKAALDFAQLNFSQQGQGYTDFTHPAIVANEIAKRLFQQAGRSYQDLTPEQRQGFINQGYARQEANKSFDQDAWKRDDFGGMLGAWTEQIQSAWESGTNEGWLPSEQALLGADNPLNTLVINKVFNKEYDPYGNEVGLPTNKNYEQAANQGYDTGAAALLNNVAKQAILMGSGGALSDVAGMGLDAAGVSQAYAPAVVGGVKGAYGAAQSGGDGTDILEGAIGGGLLSGAGGIAEGSGYGQYSGLAEGAATGYKAIKAYENDNYGALGSMAGGLLAGIDTSKIWGTTSDAIGPGGDFNLTDGPLTSNTNTDLDLLPKQEDNSMSLEDQLNQYGTDYGIDPWTQDYVDSLNQDFGGTGSSWWDSFFPSTSDASSNSGTGSSNNGTGLSGSSLGGILGGLAGGTSNGGTDYGRLLGILGASGLGAYGANQQASAYKDVAQQYMNMGGPYRDRLAQLYANPDAFLNSQEVQAPTQQATNSLARALSVKGNPYGNATALQEAQNYTANQLFGRLGEEKNRLGQLGGLASFAAAAPQAQMAGVGAQGGVYNALGYGLGSALNPQPTTLDIIKALQGGGGLA